MNKAERERSRMQREQIRKRNLRIIKLLGIGVLVIASVSLFASALSGFVSSPEEENASSGQPHIAVNSSAVSAPTPSPKPADPRLSDPLLVLVNSLAKDGQPFLILRERFF